ncbi:MAG: 50S ribosome-binding GTPase [Candidatus Micrarchaeota archaeon]|nr:50S ribosome-binding GTPase [Candidatus Micrarchaeota archaeon]
METKKIKKYLDTSHILIEVVDSRLIEQTRLKELEKKYKDKLLIVATKADLCDKIEELKSLYSQIYFVNNKTKDGIEELKKKIIELAEKKMKKNKSVDIFIFGIPNVGKSSLINSLVGRKVAQTGFRAGITKAITWIKLSEKIRIIDSPGTIEKNQEEEILALGAAIDAQKIKNPHKIALKIIKKFFETGKEENLFKNFKIEKTTDFEKIIEQIAKKRGLYLKGGELNIEEACKILIREWQKGKIKL